MLVLVVLVVVIVMVAEVGGRGAVANAAAINIIVVRLANLFSRNRV